MKDVVLIKCDSYDYQNVKNAILKGFTLLGGIEKFFKNGEKILLKPNILAGDPPERCTTTHPVIIRSVAEILLESGIIVTYGDSPGFGSPENVAKGALIKKEMDELGVKLADFVTGKEVSYKDGKLVKKFYIANAILEASGIVSIPKLKTHQFERITGAVKNQLGCIPGVRKAEYHAKFQDPYDFAIFLHDLNNFISPRLYIMDAVIAMEGNGPRGGNPKRLGAILISDDPVAIDIIACKIINLDPDFVPTIRVAKEVFGYKDEINILGEDFLKLVDKNFDVTRTPKEHYNKEKTNSFINFIKKLLISKPVIIRNKCIKCGLCVKICPSNPKALSWLNGKDKPPIYNYSLCFRCYCCQEMCPERAIKLKTPILRKILSFFLKL